MPTAGVGAADLDGDGLLPTVLGGGDAGTLVDVDNGQITSGGNVIRPASTGNLTTRSVLSGIAYRQTATNLAVITFRSLTIPYGTTLKLVGTHATVIASAAWWKRARWMRPGMCARPRASRRPAAGQAAPVAHRSLGPAFKRRPPSRAQARAEEAEGEAGTPAAEAGTRDWVARAAQ